MTVSVAAVAVPPWQHRRSSSVSGHRSNHVGKQQAQHRGNLTTSQVAPFGIINRLGQINAGRFMQAVLKTAQPAAPNKSHPAAAIHH